MTAQQRKSSFLMDHPTISTRHIRGFSLIELMIAMVLGLLIIGAVGTVFISAQQSYRTKANFEEAQEAFRFASHVINRLVQSSESIIDPDSTLDTLFIQIRGGPGIFDCTGAPVPDDATVVTNAFFLNGDSLECDPDADPTALNGVPLVSRVAALSFAFADLPDNEAPMAADFKTSGIIWGNARSVRTTITMDNGFQTFFTSTSRGASIGESITISP